VPTASSNLEPQPCLGGGCGHPETDHVRVRELEGPTQMVVWCSGCHHHEIWNTRKLGSSQKMQSILARALLTRLAKEPERRTSCAKPTPPGLVRGVADGAATPEPSGGPALDAPAPPEAPPAPTTPVERFPRMSQRPRSAALPREAPPVRRPARRKPPDPNGRR
jgi:hypothetical protein